MTAPIAGRVSLRHFTDVVSAEWAKLRSVRSSAISLGAALVLTVGLSALFCKAYVARYAQLPFAQRLTFDPAALSVSGVVLAQVAVGVLGVLVMASEHATGMIRTTYLAVPGRLQVLFAKVLVFLGVSLGIGLVAGFASFGTGQAILSAGGISTSLGAPNSLRVVIGVALYLGGIGLLGLALGAIVRRTAGAVASLFAILLVLPLIVDALPSPWNLDIEKFLPGEAGSAMLHSLVRPDLLAPWTGFAIFGAYVVVLLALAAFAVVSRDA